VSLNVSIFRRFKYPEVSILIANMDFNVGLLIRMLQSAAEKVSTSIMMEKNIVLKSLFIAILNSFVYQWLCFESLDLSG
jgi:hypothetical protein